tara:strand:- start:479 stop:1825 length:1347 start_codon:yes stop_codon:yes gene_type:complete
MAESNIQQELLRLFQQQQQQPNIELNSGLLAEGQQGLSDVFSNPDQAQVNALVGGLAGLANPRGRDPALMAVAQGAQAFQNTRMQDYERRVQGEKLRQENLKNQLQGALGIAKYGQEEQKLSENIRQFGLTEKRANDRLAFDKSKTDKTGSVQLPDGRTVRGFVRQGRLFSFDENGKTVDISGKGASFVPDSTQNISNSVSMGDKSNEAFFKADIERRSELRTKASSGREKVSLAGRIRDFAPLVQSGIGAETIGDVKSVFRTGLSLAGLEGLANKVDTLNEETLRGFAGKAIMPYIEAQGKSFSDADRKATAKIIPGLSNSPEGNVQLANLMEASGLVEQEEFNFFEEKLDRVRRGDAQSTTGTDRAFSQYIQDVSRLKRDGNVLTTVNDGRDLWKYWLDGRPSAFVLQNGKTPSISDLKQVAEDSGQTLRELLGELDSSGLIVGTK